MDETVEENVIEEIKEEIIEQVNNKNAPLQNNSNSNNLSTNSTKLSFNDVDYISSGDGNVTSVIAPKSIDRLEQISEMRANQRKAESEDDDNVKITITDQSVSLDSFDMQNIEEPKMELLPDLLIDDIEILE
jgi:hypothetical protein